MHHYETITLGSQETAKEIARRMRDVFVRDELLDALKSKLIAFTRDFIILSNLRLGSLKAI